jgi:hypothetical protein
VSGLPISAPAAKIKTWEEKMSKGFIYRFGVAVKEFGERMAHKKVPGIPVLRWCCDRVIRWGLTIKDSVMDCPMEALR